MQKGGQDASQGYPQWPPHGVPYRDRDVNGLDEGAGGKTGQDVTPHGPQRSHPSTKKEGGAEKGQKKGRVRQAQVASLHRKKDDKGER
jgi:hypothetical protein